LLYQFQPEEQVRSLSIPRTRYNFLGGVQIKDNSSDARFKPFAHALIGAGHGRTKVSSVTCPAGVDCSDLINDSETGFAGAFGGGLDIKLSNRVDFRAIQVDYNPIKFDSGTQNNVRFGVGFVFK
jgi:opacity protein-like surface antigen